MCFVPSLTQGSMVDHLYDATGRETALGAPELAGGHVTVSCRTSEMR